MASKAAPFINQAQQQSLLRYQPQLQALVELQRTAEANYAQSAAAAQASAQGQIAGVDRARPMVAQSYDTALSGVRGAGSLAAGDIASLGPGVDRFRAAGDLEQRQSASNLEASQAAALTGLDERRLGAQAGQESALRLARNTLESGLESIGRTRSDLLSQAGTYTAATAQQLQQDAAKLADADEQKALGRAVTTRGQDIASSDRQAALAARQAAAAATQAKKTAAKHAGLLPGGVKPLTVQQQNAVKDQIGVAQTWISRLRTSQHLSDHDVRAHLIAGDTLTDASGNKIKIPKLPQSVINYAEDLLAYGGLSPANVRDAHSRGLKLKALGLKPADPSAKGKQLAKAKKVLSAF